MTFFLRHALIWPIQSKYIQSRVDTVEDRDECTPPREREKLYYKNYSTSHIPTLERESTVRANRQYSYIYTDKKCNPFAQVEYFANLQHLCRLLSFWWSGCNLGPYSDGSPALLRLSSLWSSRGRASQRQQVWRYAFCCGNILHTVVLHFVAYRENNPLMSRAWASPAMTACDWNYL